MFRSAMLVAKPAQGEAHAEDLGPAVSVNVQKVVVVRGRARARLRARRRRRQVRRHDTPEYRAMNPNALVPVIEDAGFVLYESNAIVRYLAHAVSSRLWPDDRSARRRRPLDGVAVDERRPAMGDAFMQLVRTPPEQRDAGRRGVAREERARWRSSMRTSPSAPSHRHGVTTADIVRLRRAPLARPPAREARRARTSPAGWPQSASRPAFAQVLTLPIV